MGLLDRIFGRSKAKETMDEAMETAPECLHTAITPRWENPDEMGQDEKANAWVCASCGGSFTPAEAQELKDSEASRLAAVVNKD